MAKRALSRSLNVLMVRLVQQFGLEKFHFYLKRLGISSINRAPDYYGLPLVLGGAETSLWDMTQLNKHILAWPEHLNHDISEDSRYFVDDFRAPNYQFGKNTTKRSKLTD